MKTLFFFGDSLTLGVNDPGQLGWVGRLCAGAQLPVPPSTFYNLGARKHSSKAIVQRWQAELTARQLPDADIRLLFCFGTVDMAGKEHNTVVPFADSLQHCATLLGDIATYTPKSRACMLSPFPVAETGHCRRIEELGKAYAEVAGKHGIPYIDIFAELVANPLYMQDLADGIHPGAGGCEAVSAILLKHKGIKDWLYS